MKIPRSLTSLILFSFAFTLFFTPRSPLSAQGLLPFGGLVSYSVPCTCPGSIGNLWIYFTPLFLGGSSPATGALVYSPYVSTLYAWYSIGVPSSWHLGSYTPAVQACWIINPAATVTGIPCLPLPSFGLINSVGTSLPVFLGG